jgi:hypothetical protein
MTLYQLGTYESHLISVPTSQVAGLTKSVPLHIGAPGYLNGYDLGSQWYEDKNYNDLGFEFSTGMRAVEVSTLTSVIVADHSTITFPFYNPNDHTTIAYSNLSAANLVKDYAPYSGSLTAGSVIYKSNQPVLSGGSVVDVQLSWTDNSIEGVSLGSPFRVHVALGHTLPYDVTLHTQIIDRGSSASGYLTSASSTLIKAGSTSADVVVSETAAPSVDLSAGVRISATLGNSLIGQNDYVVSVGRGHADVITASDGGGLATLYEGGPTKTIHLSLPSALPYAVTIHAAVSGSPQQDLAYDSDVTIAAGSLNADLRFTALRDAILEPIESGTVKLTAFGNGAALPVLNNDFIIQVKDAVLGPLGVADLTPGLNFGKTIVTTLTNAAHVVSVTPVLSSGISDASKAFLGSLSGPATLLKLGIDSTSFSLQLEKQLVQADELSKYNPDAAGHHAYAAYETAVVDYENALIKVAAVTLGKTVISGVVSAAAEIFAAGVLVELGGTGLAAGVIMGVGSAASVTAAVPILGLVVAGWTASVVYDEVLAPLVRNAIKSQFEHQLPEADFVQSYKYSHPAASTLPGLSLNSGTSDVLNGTPNNDILVGSSNPVVFDGKGGNDVITGHSGSDTVLIHANYSDSYVTTVGQSTVTVTSTDGFDTLNNIARIQFNDGVVAFDTQGNAGNAYRLYQAAFARTPDTGGLSFWTKGLDEGVDIQSVSQGFVNSAEFKSVYGVNPSNEHLIDLFYQNVLGRAGEADGINFWVGNLNRGVPLSEVLQGFAGSPENHGHVDPIIAQGILLDRSAFLV